MPDGIWMENIERSHFEKFVINEMVHEGELESIELALEKIFKKENSVEAYSILSKANGTIAVFGGYMIVDGVAEVWAIMGSEIGKYPIAITRLARQLITHYHMKLGIRRFQMRVKKDSHTAAAWAESLGFKFEGPMKLADGSTEWIFGRNV